MLPHPVPDLATGPGKGQSMISIKVQIFVTIIRTATCLCVLCSNIFHIEVVVQVKVFVKEEEVFGITDGGPIIGADHPVMTEVFAIPIVGALCTYSNFRGVLARCFESADRCPGLAGNFQSKVLFETKGSEKLGETTGCIQASKRSSIFSVRTALHHRRARAPRNP